MTLITQKEILVHANVSQSYLSNTLMKCGTQSIGGFPLYSIDDIKKQVIEKYERVRKCSFVSIKNRERALRCRDEMILFVTTFKNSNEEL